MLTRGSLVGGLACLCVVMTGAGPQVEHREMPDDPWMPRSDARSAPRNFAHAGSSIIQVNLDGNGNNILNDAGNEPSIAVDPTAPNRMAIGWRQFDNIASDFRQAGYSFSRDGGRTWAGMAIIEPGKFRSDPVLEAGPDGTFYYSSLRISPTWIVDMIVSNDWGATWPDQHFAFGGDKQWFAIDATGGAGDGHIYQAWQVFGNDHFPAQFSRAVDGGVTWETPVQYDPINQAAFPVFGLTTVGPDGVVYVAGTLNDGVNEDFWVVGSSNAQNAAQTPTFDILTTVDMGGVVEIGVGPNPSGLLGQVNIATDHSRGPHHGNVYLLASINPPGPDPLDIHFLVSEDGGQSFSSPLRVNDDPGNSNAWQWFGQLSVAPDGRIDAVWNDTRDSGQDNISELFHSSSSDGGQTWTTNVALSPSFDSFLGWPQQNKLGDYYDLHSDLVGAHLAWAATFNGEQDVYYIRIGDYDCNGNGVGDADDLAVMRSIDCNGNGIPDECEIAAGEEVDDNGNGVPDSCENPLCPWDCGDFNGDVGINDFLAVLAQWNQVGTSCDFAGDGVGINDFLKVLAQWGPCP